MNAKLDPEAQRALGALRGKLSPTAQDSERVLLAMRRALPMAAATEKAPTHAHVAHPTTGVARPDTWKLGVALACIAALFAGVSYVVRNSEAPHRAEPRPVPRAAALPVPAAQTNMANESAALQAAGQPADDAIDTRTERVSTTDAPVARPNSTAAAIAAERRAAHDRQLRKRGLAGEKLSDSTRPAVDSLAEELRVMSLVEQSLRENRPQRALSLLHQLERSVPVGKLHEERLAASCIARCTLDSSLRIARLRDFAQTYPASVYLARVAQACTPLQDMLPQQQKSPRTAVAADNHGPEP